MMRAVIVTTHPIQNQAPLFRALAGRFDLTVVFMMQQTPKGQASAGFGTEFVWDVPLLDGYPHAFAANIARAPTTNRRDGIVLSGHEELLAGLEPDAVLVMGWFPYGYLQVIRWARGNGVPLVCRGESNLLSHRSLLRDAIKTIYFPWLFRKFKTFAVIGQRNREFYQNYGVGDFKLYDAPYSIDSHFFQEEFREHRSSARKARPWRIGFAGKLISKKRVLDLFSAAARCRSRECLRLIIIGDGPLRRDAEAFAERNNVSAEFRGFLNQSEIVEKGYADLDAIVLPSGENETWGLVINEAMTGGIPAIVSNLVGCAPDLIEPGETGYVFPSGDVPALARCIDALIARLESGHNFASAVCALVEKYSIDHTVTGLESAIAAAVSS
ncbi:MAG: hypothetical protein DLM73_14515 [Chthoniobacterales bacterium]|nr:MAG: hypothetical protein DLM73_14515 [Chthoniobacterales bacterium]